MPEALSHISPAFALILSALLCALLPARLPRKLLRLAAPVGAFLLFLAPGALGAAGGAFSVAGIEIATYRLDQLSYPFALVFILAAFLAGLFSWAEDDRAQDVAGQLYAAAALGAVLAGDLLTLFVFWELTALASVFLIWRRRTPDARDAGMRYLAMHILSGVLLLAGAVLLWTQTGSMAFDAIGLEAGIGAVLIFLAFGVKCGFPFLHAWLPDAYPRSTITGGVLLSAFTTKMAVYALARGFAGEEILIWIGVAMALFPVFFALMADDLRRVLAYSIIIQVGIMVTAIGVGTAGALNGAAGHAFADVLFKMLLFMSMGAVLLRAGTVRVSELGGLFRAMPLSALFCIVGAASVAAVPLFSGFVSKALILGAVAGEGHTLAWTLLMVAIAAAVAVEIKIPYAAFFAQNGGRAPRKAQEAPFSMLLAMGLAAALCLALAFPWGGYQWLYAILPFNTVYDPYTWEHVLTQLQLLFGAGAAFVILRLVNLYPQERPGRLLDADWFYRRAGYGAVMWIGGIAARIMTRLRGAAERTGAALGRVLFEAFSAQGLAARALPSGAMAVWTAILLGVTLIIAYLA